MDKVEQLLEAILKRMDTTDQKIDAVNERLHNMELVQENVIKKDIQLLLESVQGTNEKFRRLDELEGKVDDIQSTVSVLKALTVKK